MKTIARKQFLMILNYDISTCTVEDKRGNPTNFTFDWINRQVVVRKAVWNSRAKCGGLVIPTKVIHSKVESVYFNGETAESFALIHHWNAPSRPCN